MSDIDDLIRKTEARKRAREILGTAQERRELRKSLDISMRDVAKACGLHVTAIVLRESDEWKMKNRSLESPGGVKYIEWIAALKGIKL